MYRVIFRQPYWLRNDEKEIHIHSAIFDMGSSFVYFSWLLSRGIKKSLHICEGIL